MVDTAYNMAAIFGQLWSTAIGKVFLVFLVGGASIFIAAFLIYLFYPKLMG